MVDSQQLAAQTYQFDFECARRAYKRYTTILVKLLPSAPNGRLLASGSEDQLSGWNVQDGTCQKVLQGTSRVRVQF